MHNLGGIVTSSKAITLHISLLNSLCFGALTN